MAGRGAIRIRRLLPRTRRSWAVAVLTFFALDLLALRGSDLALDLLIFLLEYALVPLIRTLAG